jgi:hypothetical protein
MKFMGMKHIIRYVAVACFPAFMHAQLRVYPDAVGDALRRSKDYNVCVRQHGSTAWQQLSCYAADVDLDKVQTASFAQFDMGGAVDVRVESLRADVADSVAPRIRPLSKRITFATTGKNAVEFTLVDPAYLSVEFGGDTKHNLHLFANPLETETHDGSDSSCINWQGTGAQDVFLDGASLIYFGPGVHQPKDLPNTEIKIPSNTTVYLAPGAVVKGKLCIDHARNVHVIGRGLLLNPLRGFEITYSHNVLIDGITVLNPTHYTVFGGQSDSITIRNLKSFSCRPWSDGIDLMSCSDVHVDNVFLRTSDDCIAIYGHRWWYWGDSRNVEVSNSVLWADVAHNINIGTHGDDKSVDGEVIENLAFRNIDVLDEDEDVDIYRGVMAISCGDKNRIRHVVFDSIRVENIEEGRLVNLQVMFSPKYNKEPGGGVSDVTFRNITFDHATGNVFDSWIKGYDAQHAVSGVRFENVRINGRRMRNLKHILMNDFVKDVTVK